jgi:hypothetical protein
VDFWILGGASLLVWVVMTVANAFRGAPTIDDAFARLGIAALSLSLVANYPHFMASYALAYSRGRSFVLAHWWQLLAVPAGLATLLVGAYVLYDIPVANLAVVAKAREALAPAGLNAQVLSGPRLGDVLLAAAVHVMIFTIGWHYTKQVFGCVMVYAHLDGYPFTPSQRTLTRRALLAVWALAFVDNNRDGSWRTFGTFNYSSLDLPDLLAPVALAAVALGVVLVCLKVFLANYREAGRLPSLNLVVPFVAIYVWWLPITRQAEFYFVMAPLFHSLQYLAFVYKVEDSRLRRAARRHLRGTAWVVGIVLVGWLAFERVPAAFDRALRTTDLLSLPFFVIAATLFINIHHYFIDNVIWRFSDPQVREHLLQ